MVPAYLLCVDITANDAITCETEFRESLAPCVAYLDSLKGAFEKQPCSVSFYPPDPQSENSKQWSARCIVMISVGRERGEYLLELYQAIVNLIIFELPDFEIQAEASKLNFS
ncbi:MAG: hypothetical protein FWD60_09025 [Candidatus Azobacteroides sp.]|nr:hypothetical protein [Candidatus Azobacteroides sp.]